MFYDYLLLKNLLQKYEIGEIGACQIGLWAEQAYCDFLKGGFIDVRKIMVYPFVKTLSKIHTVENEKDDVFPCTENDVKNINHVLRGDKDYSFPVQMCLSDDNPFLKDLNVTMKPLKTSLKEIKSAIHRCDEKSMDMSLLNDLVIRTERTCKMLLEDEDTIYGLLTKKIKILFECIINFDVSLPFSVNSLYLQKGTNNWWISKADEIIDCYLGNRNFLLIVRYINSTPKIALI